MTSETMTQSEALVKLSRRGLWVALMLVLALGAYAIVVNVAPTGTTATLANRLFGLLPMAIVIGLGWLRGSQKSARANPRGSAMKALLNDELRQQSLHLAYRNGLVTVLIAQPVLALLLTEAPIANALLLMASATASAGALVVLCSMLFYDR